MKDLWRYDPAADSWTALPDYPGMGTRSPLLTFYNNELIVMNGYSRSSATSYSSTRDHYILSLSNNTWRKGPVPTYWTSGESTYVTVGEYFYCTYYFSTISLLQYHIPSGKWEIPNMPFVAGARGFLLKGKIYFITSTREVWVYDPGSYVATPSDLTSELKDGHLKIKWKNNSSVPVTTVLEYQKNSQNGSVAFTKLAEISGGTTEYEVSDYKLNTHYYIRAYNINAKGEFSPYSNITTAHTGPYWSKVADIPITSRTGAFLQAADNKLFYGLGSESGTSNLQKDLWMYDEVTGVWTQKANYVGAARYNTESFVLGGALYVGMGMNSSSIDFSDLYKYDISTNTWTASVSFPKANYRRFSVFVYNGNAYFVGGQVNTSNSSVELYRFSGSAWTQLTSIPGDPRADPITFVIGGKAYVGSGEKIVNGSYYTANKEFFEYDIASDTWKKLADLPHEALYTHGAWSSFSYVVNDFAYVFVQGSRNTFKYTPATGIWSTSVTSLYTYSSYQVPMAISNSGLAYGVVNMPDKTELWRFDPLIGGPSITELTNPAIRTVMVRWNEIIPQPDSVFVERGISEEDAFVKVAVVKTNSTTTTDIVPEGGKDYYYRIRSFKGASNVRLSAAKKINVALPPTGPALSIIYDEGNAKLSWTAITGATQYGVEKSVNDGPFTALATVTGTSYTDALPEQKKYSYRVYSINPETRRSNEVFLLITGAEQSYASGFSIYPNPASDEIEVQVPEPGMNYQCTMLNNNGKTLFSTVVRNSSRINISAYPAGIYFITLQPENAVYSKVIKVVKK
jgi:N-acetylneuraminic acid mutarotase